MRLPDYGMPTRSADCGLPIRLPFVASAIVVSGLEARRRVCNRSAQPKAAIFEWRAQKSGSLARRPITQGWLRPLGSVASAGH